MANIDRIKLPDNSEYDLQARVIGAVNGNVAVMDGNGNVADGGTKLSDLKSGHRNLINNPFFTINERGQSSYSVTGNWDITFDGWLLESENLTTVTVTQNADGSVTLDKAVGSGYAQIKSYLPDSLAKQLVGKEVTFSIKTSGGLFEGTWTVPATNDEAAKVVIDNGWTFNYVSYFNLGTNENYVRILSESGTLSPVTIYSVKLEVGSTSTLENDVAPDYAFELAKCQTSTAIGSDTYANQGNLVVSNAIAPTEDGATASKAYAEGEYFIRGGKLCICKTAISSGGSFTLNTNYLESPNLGYELRNKRIVRAREVIYAAGVSSYGSEKVMCIEFSDGSILVNGAMKVSASYTSGESNYLLFTLPSGITFPHSTRQRWAVFNEFLSGNKAIPILFGDPGNTAKAWSSAVTLADLQDKNFIVDISW